MPTPTRAEEAADDTGAEGKAMRAELSVSWCQLCMWKRKSGSDSRQWKTPTAKFKLSLTSHQVTSTGEDDKKRTKEEKDLFKLIKSQKNNEPAGP